jgi:hypothetical protein
VYEQGILNPSAGFIVAGARLCLSEKEDSCSPFPRGLSESVNM